MNKLLVYLRKTDPAIWFLCLILSGLSLLLLTGIMDSGYSQLLGITPRNIGVQAVSVFIGLCCAVILSIIGYKEIVKLCKLHVPLCYALLLLTFLVGVGAPGRPDDKRWLAVPGLGLTFQPAELLRISFIVVFAYHISTVRERINEPATLGKLLLHGMIPVVLLHFQGDDGSALICVAIMACMLFAAGINWKYMLGAVLLLGISLPLLWNVILNDFQKRRILALHNPTAEDIQGFFYQQHRALAAFASGGMQGKGIFNVEHTYVPEMHNDFIFAFLGECMGVVGCLLVIGAMCALWLKILFCAYKADDILGKMICIGVFGMLSFQAVINIGMNLSILPVIGNTLPFLSYGGSSMLTSYLCIGLVLSVSMHSSKTMFY